MTPTLTAITAKMYLFGFPELLLLFYGLIGLAVPVGLIALAAWFLRRKPGERETP